MDGYRAIAVVDSAGKARRWSRNRLPLEPKFPMVLEAVNQLKLPPRFQLFETLSLVPTILNSYLGSFPLASSRFYRQPIFIRSVKKTEWILCSIEFVYS
jgi:hypothetical protein